MAPSNFPERLEHQRGLLRTSLGAYTWSGGWDRVIQSHATDLDLDSWQRGRVAGLSVERSLASQETVTHWRLDGCPHGN